MGEPSTTAGQKNASDSYNEDFTYNETKEEKTGGLKALIDSLGLEIPYKPLYYQDELQSPVKISSPDSQDSGVSTPENYYQCSRPNRSRPFSRPGLLRSVSAPRPVRRPPTNPFETSLLPGFPNYTRSPASPFPQFNAQPPVLPLRPPEVADEIVIRLVPCPHCGAFLPRSQSHVVGNGWICEERGFQVIASDTGSASTENESPGPLPH